MPPQKVRKTPRTLTAQRAPRARVRRGAPGTKAVDVVGVVRPRAVSGERQKGDTQHTLSVPLTAWRVGDGPVCRGELVVRQRVGQRAMMEAMMRLARCQVVRLKVRLTKDDGRSSPGATLVRIIGAAKDAEVLRAARGRGWSPTVKDPRLGTFKRQRSGEFRGKAAWNGTRVEMELEPDDRGAAEGALEHARRLLGAHRLWDQRITKKLITGPYKEWKRVWRVEADPVLSAERFVAMLRLTTIVVSPDGGFSFWYDDADLFAGHGVVVRGRVQRGVSDTSVDG